MFRKRQLIGGAVIAIALASTTSSADITFTDINAGLPGVSYGTVAWGDFDNDGDLDILLGSGVIRNNGAGVFTDINAGLPGGTGAWGDYDNDGDLDILLAMYDTEGFSRIYRNDDGVFTDTDARLPGVIGGDAAWGDYDNDGDLDILLSGDTSDRYDPTDYDSTHICRNDGYGMFTEINAGLIGVRKSSVAWGDYDNDGDLDVMLAGGGHSRWNVISRIYRNDDGVFTDINAGLPGAANGSVTWGDYDNDGDLDVLLGGVLYTGVDPTVSSIYRNDRSRGFNVGLPGLMFSSSVTWGDYDNDGDLDILGDGNVLRSDGARANTPPTAPTGLTAQLSGDRMILGWSWDSATDDRTPIEGLSYNIRIGTSPGGNEIMSAMANSADGYRRVVQLGNAQQQSSWTVRIPGSFFWSVQAVDGAYAGSPFATEQTVGLYRLTAFALDHGTVTKDPDQVLYLQGSTVTLTAIPNAEWRFESWSGDASENVNPLVVTMDEDKTIVATFAANPSYVYVTQWGDQGSGDGRFKFPMAVAVNVDKNVYVADLLNYRIQRFTSNGGYLTQWGSQGNGNGQFAGPFGIAVDNSRNVYVADLPNQCIQKFDGTGTFLTKWGSVGSDNGQFRSPYDVAVDVSGNVYVTDTGNNRIQKFTSTGTFLTKWGSSGSGNQQFNELRGIAVDDSGNVYVVDSGNYRVQKFTSNGTFLAKWGSLGSGDGEFNAPSGIAVDGSGNVYVADTGNNRIQRFTRNRVYCAQWGKDASFNSPNDVAVDASGYAYVADTGNNRIQKFAPVPDLPTPTIVSLVATEVRQGKVRLVWYAARSRDMTVEVYRRTENDPWESLGIMVANATGYLEYEDVSVISGQRYGYRLEFQEGGEVIHAGEVWVDVPQWALTVLDIRPNPVSGSRLSVTFTLPVEARATLELLDVSGRRVVSREVGSFGIGQHTVNLMEGRRLSPGLYFVRLMQGPNQKSEHIVVIQ